MRLAVRPDAEQKIGLGVQLRGRTFPMPKAEPDSARKSETPCTRSNAEKELSRQLKERLSFFNDEGRCATTAELTEVYVDSLQSLERCRQDVFNLVPDLCEANLVFRQGMGDTAQKARAEVMEEKLSDMIAKTQLSVRPANNVVDAELLALPKEQSADKLRKSLESNIQRFVADFFEALNQLVDQQIAGLVEWTGQNACKYHFFREVIVQDQLSTNRRSKGRRRSTGSPTGWVENVVTTDGGSHTHRLARHEHHTTDAFQTGIEDTAVIMPRAVQKLVENMPDWLQPIVRVIDGKLAREIVVERDIKTETWEQHDVRDVPVFGCEPAVVIDHIVLTGWGPRDIDEELDRRKKLAEDEHREAELARAHILAPVGWTLGTSLSILSFMFFWQSSAPLAIGLAFFLVLLAIPCWIIAFVSSSFAGDRPVANARLFAASLGISSIVAGFGLMLSFAFVSTPVILTGAAITVCGITLLVATRPKQPSDLERQAREYWNSI